MDVSQKPRKNYIPEVAVGLGYFFFLILATVACVGGFYLYYAGRAAAQSELVTYLPPTTPTPHVLATPVMGITGVFTDDFGTDANEWVSWIDRSKVGVHSGHFVLEAPGQYSFNTAVCNKCPRLEKPYYLQAAFGIDGATNANYGLIIKAESGLPTDRFYLFMVSPEARRYSLWFHTENAWYARLSGASDRIRSSPATNVLGIYVNGGNVELYIGGAIVDAFEDSGTSLLTGKPGFYAEADSGVKVLIDDFLFENMGGE